jgi:hypothetical protein
MPVFDFLGYLSAARKKQKEEFRQQLKASAFTGWQFAGMLKGILGGKKDKQKTFLQYSAELGLLSEEEKQHYEVFKMLEKIKQEKEAEQAIKKAANIIEMDRANRQRKGG